MKKEKSFLCLDEKDLKGQNIDLRIYGSDEMSPHIRLDIVYKPCTPIQLTIKNEKY